MSSCLHRIGDGSNEKESAYTLFFQRAELKARRWWTINVFVIYEEKCLVVRETLVSIPVLGVLEQFTYVTLLSL